MSDSLTSRRRFLEGIGATACTLCIGRAEGATKESKTMLHLATNQYPWSTFYARDGRRFEDDLDAGLCEVAAAGLNGFEPIANSPQDIDRLAPLLGKHKLEMRSLYVNSTLHEPGQADKSIAHVLAVAERAKKIGTRIIVTNPNPVRWGGAESKTDAQLETQATALDQLGRLLAARGLTLAYHNHDAELRHAAREFHHMMVATDPKHVTLCLDSHWIFRGSGNSAVAVYDVVTLYGARVSEWHLRQSVDGVWTETFGEGDIDYARIAKHLSGRGVKPHLVLEQAVEAKTPKALGATDAHRTSCEHARRLLACLAE